MSFLDSCWNKSSRWHHGERLLLALLVLVRLPIVTSSSSSSSSSSLLVAGFCPTVIPAVQIRVQVQRTTASSWQPQGLLNHQIPPPRPRSVLWKLAAAENDNDSSLSLGDLRDLPTKGVTKKASLFVLPIQNKNQQQSTTLHRRIFRRLFAKDKSKVSSEQRQQHQESLQFTYDYDELYVGGTSSSSNPKTIGVVLIHPIGVGISRWFYERLFHSLSNRHDNDNNNITATATAIAPRLVVLAPDLLGSGSASNPTVLLNVDDGDDDKDNEKGEEISSLRRIPPLYNISDWTSQIVDLMAKTESEQTNNIDQWCIVTNGGCSPIALQVAQRSVDGTALFQKEVTNIILSSLPGLAFFQRSSDPNKVQKSYQTLCGVLGKAFWWYSCRNHGAFIQKFSEKNLVAEPANLGPNWRNNCYQTAKANGGTSRYSTFSFLAGTLQDGCAASLEVLKESGKVSIDLIRGRDVRRNRAKSWFWQKPKKKKKELDSEEEERPPKTFREFLMENGYSGGREALIGGRISLAHEDSDGYSDAIVEFLGTK